MTPEYGSWYRMIDRCLNPAYKGFKDYGARGIAVCERWQDPDGYEHFREDLGPKPSRKHMVERIDNSGMYSCGYCQDCLKHGWPANCCWATRAEQARNKRNNVWLEYAGKRMCVEDWADFLGFHQSTILNRIARGYPMEVILSRRPLKLGRH